jgi:hypothetical protein
MYENSGLSNANEDVELHFVKEACIKIQGISNVKNLQAVQREIRGAHLLQQRSGTSFYAMSCPPKFPP